MLAASRDRDVMLPLHVNGWPAALALLIAATWIVALRVVERWAHRLSVKRTRQALQDALSSATQE